MSSFNLFSALLEQQVRDVMVTDHSSRGMTCVGLLIVFNCEIRFLRGRSILSFFLLVFSCEEYL
jgi:hypothetical protein